MKQTWIEAHELPENEQVYLKKDWLGWRVVEPNLPGDSLTKKLIGSKRNIFISVIIIILALLFYLGVNEIIAQYKDIANSPCNYCPTAPHLTGKTSTDNINGLNITLPGDWKNG